MKAKMDATKKGTLVPNSAKKPPTPGPIMNPVLMEADIKPSALGRSSGVVISAIKAVTAGIIHPALTPPKMREIKSTSIDRPIPNRNSEILNKISPMIIIIFLPNRSVHFPVMGETINWVKAKAATMFPKIEPLMDNSFIMEGMTGITKPIPAKAMNKLDKSNANVTF